MTEDSDSDDDTPWASPEIRTNYEAALGRFILAFNQIDNQLTDIIETVLRRLKRADVINACTKGDFSHKLLVLDLLKHTTEGQGIQRVSVEAMRQVAGERNRLAHGHFDQNPLTVQTLSSDFVDQDSRSSSDMKGRAHSRRTAGTLRNHGSCRARAQAGNNPTNPSQG
jgi:hypothetical protein